MGLKLCGVWGLGDFVGVSLMGEFLAQNNFAEYSAKLETVASWGFPVQTGKPNHPK